MQLVLSSTTKTLEIETSIAGSIHVEVCYSDITDADASNPADAEYAISTATTTTIVAAPAASTSRKIQYLNVFNNGVTQAIKLKKDISGTEYILLKCTLQNGEALRIVNDKITVIDASGREKQQNSEQNNEIGESRSIFKVGTVPEAAGVIYCFSKDTGFPGAWAPGTPGVNGRNTDGTQAADVGCMNVGNPASGAWYLRDGNIVGTQTGQFIIADILWINTGLVVTTLTAQTFTQPTLPARDNNGATNGDGIQAGVLVTTVTTNASAITNMTMSYTNSDGVSGRTATIASFPATAVVGSFVKFQLQAGDKGVRSIQSVALGTSLVTGAISIVCFEELYSCSSTIANVGQVAFAKKLDLRLYDGHCLIPFWFASGTGAVTISGNMYFVNK